MKEVVVLISLFLIPVLYGVILWIDFQLVAPTHSSTRSERILYRILITLALISAIPVGIAQQLDHVGASLSGLVSVFLR